MTNPTVYRYEVCYSWPSTFRGGDGKDWPTTAHGGFVGDFARPLTEADWPALAELVQVERPDIAPVTIASVTPSV